LFYIINFLYLYLIIIFLIYCSLSPYFLYNLLPILDIVYLNLSLIIIIILPEFSIDQFILVSNLQFYNFYVTHHQIIKDYFLMYFLLIVNQYYFVLNYLFSFIFGIAFLLYYF
jgi:hypothetical protein